MSSTNSTRARPLVHIASTSGTCAVLTSTAPDALLVQHIKALPQASRRWDKRARCWRIRVTYIQSLVEAITRDGFVVADERNAA